MSAPSKFTEEVQRKIEAAVQSGAFLWVAAGIADVHRSTLHRWLTSTKAEFKAFQERMELAEAFARFRAEAFVFKEDPKYWLTHGPGRERRAADGTLLEGWSNAPAMTINQPTQVNVLLSPEWQVYLATVLDALLDYPEARRQVAAALAKVGVNKPVEFEGLPND